MRWNLSKTFMRLLAYLVVICLMGIGIWWGRPLWQPLLGMSDEAASSEQEVSLPTEEPKVLELGAPARANLQLVAAPAKVQNYWRTIQIPGVIEDRPGITDRGITAPLAGVVTQVHAFEGDIIRPGEKLFTLRLVSDYLQQTQSNLFRAIREVEISNQEIQRIQELIDSGAIPGKRKVELQQEKSRQQAGIEAYRQDLLSRGLSKEQVDQVEVGKFLTSIVVVAPEQDSDITDTIQPVGNSESTEELNHEFFEIQDLKVDLGQQVEAGQVLAVLANHNFLFIKGHAFKKEASRLARAAEEDWIVGVEFTEDTAADWPPLEEDFRIRHLANTTEPNSRTFDFFIPLSNQSRVYEKDGRPFVIWRFRPGQRVTISVPVEQIENVIVLPSAGVAFEGPEAFVFQQNGDLFNRIPAKVLHRDRYHVIIANDGAISPGMYLAQNAAASLNRVLKAQAASGMQPGFHMHADGSVHGAH